MSKTLKPFGTWPSNITAETLVASQLRLGEIQIEGDRVWWTESRPAEGGRTVLMSRTPYTPPREEVLSDMNVRTRVHEYGGGAFHIQNGQVFFCNFKDQALYSQVGERGFRSMTTEENTRFADFILDTPRNRLISVAEVHGEPGWPENRLVGIHLDGGGLQTLQSGHDFYSNPTLSPDRRWLAFLTWDQPNMPWDGTDLWRCAIRSDGSLDEPEHITGGISESIFQPQWGPEGELFFASDRSRWWNLYLFADGEIRTLLPMEAEFGLPQWVFGMSTYAPLDDGRLVATYTRDDKSHLIVINPQSGEVEEIQTPYRTLTQIRSAGNLVAFLGGAPDRPTALISLDLATRELTVLRQAGQQAPPQEWISIPDAMVLPVEGRKVHALYYPPRNPDYAAPAGTAPPLIVKSHGGPTSQSLPNLSLEIQFWTSRGFAVVDVNYSGSTGYGRPYRERLNEQWGILDVKDCAGVAQALVRQGLADGERLAIRGGSAGGYTTLNTLTFRDDFKAGASYYGVSDLELLARDTHKFEGRYLDRLVGPYPERQDIYQARSAIHHVDQLNCPVIFLQGEDDPVVPPNQAETMVAALEKAGIPVAYLSFPGESHGFRKAETTIAAIQAELAFYAYVFSLELSEDLPEIEIRNRK